MISKPVVIAGGVGVAAIVGFMVYSRMQQPTENEDSQAVVTQPPVYFMPAGNANYGGGDGGGSNIPSIPSDVGLPVNVVTAFPYMSDEVAENTPITINPLTSDPIMASQAVAQTQIESSLVAELANYGADLLNNVLRQFAENEINPSQFTGSFNVVGGQTTFSYEAVNPVISAPPAPPAPPKKVYTSNDIIVPSTWQQGQTQDALWENILGQFNMSHTSSFGIPMNRPWSSDSMAMNAYNSLKNQYVSAKLAELNA